MPGMPPPPFMQAGRGGRKSTSALTRSQMLTCHSRSQHASEHATLPTAKYARSWTTRARRTDAPEYASVSPGKYGRRPATEYTFPVPSPESSWVASRRNASFPTSRSYAARRISSSIPPARRSAWRAARSLDTLG